MADFSLQKVLSRLPFLFLSLLLNLSWKKSYWTDASIPCNSDDECQALLLPASYCIAGYCSNPFQRGGCLANMKDGWTKVRVCNSDDPPDAEKLGYCKQPREPFDYMEVRILTQNWDTVFLESWLLQMLLSELLDVPTTLETGTPDAELNFYHPESPVDFGTSNDWDAFKTARDVVDCRLVKDQGENIKDDGKKEGRGQGQSSYTPCAHVCPEVWGERIPRIRELGEEGYFDPPLGLGVLGQLGWYVPRFTAIRDPTVLTHFGLSGDDNREKLANLFLRPTRWGDYCDEESNVTCLVDDGVAKRRPTTDDERAKFFVDGLYTGYFRKTAKNNCTGTRISNCTGHIADFPCTWLGNMQAQLYHLDIPLESDGEEPHGGMYNYTELVDMLSAANATKSNLMLYWWTPEGISEQYVNTDAELVRVTLTKPSQDCLDARIGGEDRCTAVLEDRVGDPEGSCDDVAHTLAKILSPVLYEVSNDPNIPGPKRSPAYEAIKLFTISNFQLGKMFEYWFSRNLDQWGHDPRFAACQWFVENLDYLKDFVPKNFPRTLKTVSPQGPLYYTALSVAVFATIGVLTSFVMVYIQREKRAIRYAQTEFLVLLLVGLLVVVLGSFVATSVQPSNVSCIATVWLINLGYTLELVPLIVKVGALNQLAQAAKKMKRLRLSRKQLFQAVIFLSALSVIFMTCWTIIAPPNVVAKYHATTDVNEQGVTIITVTHYCSFGGELFRYGAVAWTFAYLIIATVLAYQTRKVVQAFNESQVLAFMIYSHFMFAMLRVALFLLEGSLREWEIAWIRSLIFSCDVIATLCIYFFPKFFLALGTDDPGVGFTNNNSNNNGATHQQTSFPASSTRSKNLQHQGSIKAYMTANQHPFSLNESIRSQSVRTTSNNAALTFSDRHSSGIFHVAPSSTSTTTTTTNINPTSPSSFSTRHGQQPPSGSSDNTDDHDHPFMNDTELIAMSECLLSLDRDREHPTLTGGFQHFVELLKSSNHQNHKKLEQEQDVLVVQQEQSPETTELR